MHLHAKSLAVGPEQVEQAERIGSSRHTYDHALPGRQQMFALQ
jgi:hypothetical protein